MHIKGWVKTSLVDYPERIAASFFCGGCNFRCPNCHNSGIVLHPGDFADLDERDIWSFLERRVGLLDGVVLSGGEPTLQPDLLSFAARIRGLGYQVKLDTNGYRPEMVRAMIDRSAVDYVAMDVKAPLVPTKYARAAGVPIDVDRIRHTIDLLLEGQVGYEFRTTVVPGLLTESDVVQIAQAIGGARHYYLQQFVARNTLDSDMLKLAPYPPDQVRAMAELAGEWVENIDLRGL
jgi:pyruvate formate lyase activating enzyme